MRFINTDVLIYLLISWLEINVSTFEVACWLIVALNNITLKS